MRQSEEGPRLLVFIHPHCPCSNATISELERLVAHAGPQLSTVVIFWHPEGVAADWHQTPLWKRTRNIPGVPVIDDAGCLITRRFGVTTSGQALLYDRTGKLQFAGGITPARGHAGDNAGNDLVLSLMNGDSLPSGTPPKSCAVFGCPFIDSQTMASSVEHQP